MTTTERLRRKLERSNPCPCCEQGSLLPDRSERGNKRRCHLCAWGGPTRRAAKSDMEDLARDAPRMTVTVAEANRMRYRARDLEQQGLSTSQIAKAIGRSKSTVAGYLVGVENESQRGPRPGPPATRLVSA